MSADTGVGPAMASPSHDCSGNCADLPHAPSRSMRPMAVSTPSDALPAFGSTTEYATDPKPANMTMMAIESPKSPTRLTTNAFFAAVAYAGLWFQKPMSRYDARPTPSQPTYSSR